MITSHVQVTAVQARWSLEAYRDAMAFEGFVRRLMDEANARRDTDLPHLVVFPEFIGLPLIFLDAHSLVKDCVRWREAGALLAQQQGQGVAQYCHRFGVSPTRGLMLASSHKVHEVYTRTFAQAALDYNCYLVAGSAALPDFADGQPRDGSVYNVSYFFAPDGLLLGAQKKVHLFEEEGTPEGLDLVAALPSDVRAFPTEFGNVGIAICLDAFHDDVMSALASQNVTFIAQPSANARAWDEWQADDWKNGLRQKIQDHPALLYGINPMMVGSLFAWDDELSCQGRSSIVTKTELTHDESGTVAIASNQPWGRYTKEEIVTAELEL
jgi:predicted amidohydrolase